MSRLQDAVFQVLEGFTLSDDVRKILEAAYHSDDSFTQGRAAGLEEERAAFKQWAKLDEMNPRRLAEWFPVIEFAWNAWQARAAIPSVALDTETVRAYAIYRTNPEENEGNEFFYYAMWHNDMIPGDGERVVSGYFTPDAALSSLEVIGKGEKG